MSGEYSIPWKILQLKFWPELRLMGNYAHNKENEATSQ